MDVNPEGKLDYNKYLRLDKLLACQVPSSKIPDERIFIITHQLFELVFKLMIFDLRIVAETFDKILSLNESRLRHMSLTAEERSEEFWRPAMTASARIKLSSKELLPIFLKYLGGGKVDDETFSSTEFYYFRNHLSPASGFQTAQFRLIQRAFGKSNLLSVPLFPGKDYRKHYSDEEKGGHVPVVDPLILRDDAIIATPEEHSPLALVAHIDQLAHKILSKLPSLPDEVHRPGALKIIQHGEIERAMDHFQNILYHSRKNNEKAGDKQYTTKEKDQEANAFQQNLKKAVQRENTRRESLKSAREGAYYLHKVAHNSYLAQVLRRLISADQALHGSHKESFLSNHLGLAGDRIKDVKDHAKKIGAPEPPEGTAGGGVAYLRLAFMELIPLFPALIAYQDLVDIPVWSWIE